MAAHDKQGVVTIESVQHRAVGFVVIGSLSKLSKLGWYSLGDSALLAETTPPS